MKDLKLPVIKKTRTEKRVLSMDEYLEFVQFNRRHAFNQQGYDAWKKMSAVNVPFTIRPTVRSSKSRRVVKSADVG